MVNTQDIQRVESCLTGLGKLIKAGQFYPPEHPAFEAALQHELSALRPLAKESGLLIEVSRESFRFEDKPVAPGNVSLKKMAAFFFTRRIRSLLFLPQIEAEDLRELSLIIGLETAEILNQGGIQQILRHRELRAIQVNELDPLKNLIKTPSFQGEMHEKQASSLAQKKKAELPQNLAQLLERLQQSFTSEHYVELLKIVPRLALRELTPAGAESLTELCCLLGGHARAEKFTEVMQKAALQTLDQLLTPDHLHLSLEKLCSNQLSSKDEKRFVAALLLHDEKVFFPTLEELALARDPVLREGLTQLAIQLSAGRTKHLIGLLREERLPIRQVALRLLGRLRAQEAVDVIVELLDEVEHDLHRELLGTLARIGGEQAQRALIDLATSRDSELQTQAILTLGAMRSQKATGALLRILEKVRLKQTNLELMRTLVKTLGQIGSPEAVPLLAKVLKKKSFWKRTLRNDYRCALALALAEIGGDEARQALEQASQDRNSRVADCASRALIKLPRNESHEY